jgi:lysophospholipase L1-like esterase
MVRAGERSGARRDVPSSRLRWLAAAVVAACLALVAGAVGAAGAAPGDGAGSAATHEVGTWGGSADRTTANISDQTVRDIVHTSVGGSGLRLRLSNAFGSQAITFGRAFVGMRDTGATIQPGTNRQVTFGGGPSVTIPPGAEVLSDPVPGDVPAQADLAVSLYLQGAGGTVTGHNLATSTNYVSTTGDHSAEESAAAFTTTASRWYWLDGVELTDLHTVGTVATLGDSITDGFRSTPNANNRWPDVMARRLLERPEPRQLGVLNEGISGNRVLTDGAGVSAQARLDRDVLSQPAVETVILLEGINDIGGGQATSADQLIAAYRQLIARAHADGKCILGGTMTPFEGAGYYSEAKEAIREAANAFIRNSGEFDGVIDFDKVTRDPADPKRFLPLYDSGDHLHPNDTGYQAMGDAVNLKLLDCKR